MSDLSNQLATSAAKLFVGTATDLELSVMDTVIACETFMVIVLCYVAMTESVPANRQRYVAEMIDAMTERANGRIVEYLKEAP